MILPILTVLPMGGKLSLRTFSVYYQEKSRTCLLILYIIYTIDIYVYILRYVAFPSIYYLLIISNFFADKNVMVFMIIIIFIVKSGF